MATASIYSAVTVCKMTTMNSSKSVTPTLTAMATASTAGVYIDCKNLDASKMILIIQKTATGANSASKEHVMILDGDSKAGYSGFAKGNLTIDIASGAADVAYAGPFETARFKDSLGNIEITCTNGTNVAAIGAILI